MVFTCLALSMGRSLLAGDGADNAAEEKQASHQGPACFAVDPYFAEEVWAKVGETTCLKCHRAGGDAEDSAFILQSTADRERRRQILGSNQAAFERMAQSVEGDSSRLLSKVTGGLDHGGGEVVKQDSTHYKILASYVERLNQSPPDPHELARIDAGAKDLFRDVAMLPPSRLLRRVTLSLAARLPTAQSPVIENVAGLFEAVNTVASIDSWYIKFNGLSGEAIAQDVGSPSEHQ